MVHVGTGIPYMDCLGLGSEKPSTFWVIPPPNRLLPGWFTWCICQSETGLRGLVLWSCDFPIFLAQHELLGGKKSSDPQQKPGKRQNGKFGWWFGPFLVWVLETWSQCDFNSKIDRSSSWPHPLWWMWPGFHSKILGRQVSGQQTLKQKLRKYWNGFQSTKDLFKNDIQWMIVVWCIFRIVISYYHGNSRSLFTRH